MKTKLPIFTPFLWRVEVTLKLFLVIFIVKNPVNLSVICKQAHARPYASCNIGGLFSDQRTVSDPSIEKIPIAETKHELDVPPTREEIKKAIAQVKPRKSPGSDGILAEVYQHGGEVVLSGLKDLFVSCWERGVLPKDLKDAVIVSLYKNKGEKSDCSNYCDITLLCSPASC